MKQYYGYIRVSTTRQKKHGVSLQEQRSAVEALAKARGFVISKFFEDHITATKPGRPQFDEMMKLLKAKKAAGVIIHKIDRSARNTRDWADIGDLVDAGIEIHFANESLDLTSRGGRLAADIQAVVATDYVRNLREEVKKGFYGRLKQGFYPMPAPLGYLNQGKAKPKLIDPERGPLVKKAFELYATGKYSQASLRAELHRLGLRDKHGFKIRKNFLGRAFRNVFYIGLIQIQKTNQTFLGVHAPLISKRLFDEVQRVLAGNVTAALKLKHEFLFRRLFWCKRCGHTLIPERQKGHVYYRCQRKLCPTKCIREEPIDQKISANLESISLEPAQHAYLSKKLNDLKGDWAQNRNRAIESVEIQLAQAKDRLTRLTDAYLDNAIDRETFEQRKAALLMERRSMEDKITDLRNGSPELPKKLDRLLELLNSPYLQYISGTPEEKKELVQNTFSNRTLDEKTLEISLALPFSEVAVCVENTAGGASRENARTWDELAEFIFDFCLNK